jgi:hypothetical protein
MEPYRVGGDYDRPIPRRILEELGIPRGSFGGSKKGYSICFNYSSLWWSPRSLRDLREFERQVVARGRTGRRYLTRRTLHSAVVSGYYLALNLSRRVRAARWPRSLMKRLKPDFPVYEHNHPRYGGLAFLWALSKVKSRYPTRDAVARGQ